MITFIKDLELANRLSSEFADAFEDFIPKWLNYLVPFYQVAKDCGDDMLELVNYLPMGATYEPFEKDGIQYYRHWTCGLSFIGFDSKNKYQPVGWQECFRLWHPEYEDDDPHERICNFIGYNSYMSRISNTKPPYNELSKRIDAHFKTITGDSTVGFSLGYKSYICFNENAKQYVDRYHKLD